MEPGRAGRIDRAMARRSGQRRAGRSAQVDRSGSLGVPRDAQVDRSGSIGVGPGGKDWSSLRAGSAQERPGVRRGDQNRRQVVSRSDKTREFVRTARSRSIVGAIFR